MNILCITHADFEGPGVVEAWALGNGYNFRVVRPYKGESLDHEFYMLIVMGGPQSAINLHDYPYLADEITLIKKALLEKKKVLGFCLGAQLISAALESTPEKSPEKEVGVYPVTLTKEGITDPLLKGLPQSFPVIHWHNDMPGLPADSTILAHSQGCPRQIIRFKPFVYGFQCHLEIDLDGMKAMAEAVPEDLNPSKFTQDKNQLLNQDYESINAIMVQVLENFSALTSG